MVSISLQLRSSLAIWPAAVGQYRAMHHVTGGIRGIPGNAESVTYGDAVTDAGSNPTLTARSRPMARLYAKNGGQTQSPDQFNHIRL